MLEFLFFFKERKKKKYPLIQLLVLFFFYEQLLVLFRLYYHHLFNMCDSSTCIFYVASLFAYLSLSLWLVNITFYVVLWMIFGIFWCPLELMTRPTQISHLNTELFSANQNSEVDGFWSMIEQQKAASLKVNFS